MRGFIPDYRFYTPANLADALEQLASNRGAWRPFAGGTDLMVLLDAGRLPDKNFLNIWNLPELRTFEVSDTHVSLGALTTFTAIQSHAVLREEFPMLCQSASETGGIAIQNRGTLGGNIVNASPAADSPPALLAYDAELELLSAQGARWVPYQGFHTGYKQMTMQSDELLARIRLRRPTSNLRQYYRKVGTRKAQAISKVCFAATAETDGPKILATRIAFGSVAPIPLRCIGTEEFLTGQVLNSSLVPAARSVLASEIAPIDDFRSTRDYRLQVSLNLLEDFLVGGIRRHDDSPK
jgi:CO/xanthine dehydrogenase FAD-binding subunit